METITCDILVVGAGPAGASAAREAAGRGARVVVVERRAVIGAPVQCAEYIPKALLGEIRMGRGFVVQPVRGMRTLLNGRVLQETVAPGYMIQRDLFDQALAETARKAGASICLSTRALSRNGGEVVISRQGAAPARVNAKVIIGADGPRSRVGGWIESVNRNLIPAVQVRADLARPMDVTEVFFDNRIHGGYGWLFPRGEEANVGLGMKDYKGTGQGLRSTLLEFLAGLVKQGKIKGKPRRLVAGWVPAERPRSVRRDNVLLAGDAAGHTHPITGAGVAHAVIGGRMAGKWAARAVDSGDMNVLSGYESEWRDHFGESLDRGYLRRRLLERHWDRLDEIIQYCWVAFREYHEPYEPYEPYEPPAGAGARDGME